MNNLNDLCKKWEVWSKTTNQNEDGWQSNFPKWKELVELVKNAMFNEIDESTYKNIEFCWCISNETEDLVDFSKQNIDKFDQILVRLSKSKFPEVRWQVYEVFSNGSKKHEKLLRCGLVDKNLYCRRRAILAISNYELLDIENLIKRFIKSKDPYIRLATLELIKKIKKRSVKDKFLDDLSKDFVGFVRNSAIQISEES